MPKYEREKIIIMSKLAIYDKVGFEKDAKSNNYFQHDYVYKQNMIMRFFLFFGCLILITFYVMDMFLNDELDILTADFMPYAITFLGFIVVVMVFYSIIGTIIYTRKFNRSRRKVEEYFALMDRLNALNTPDEAKEDYL